MNSSPTRSLEHNGRCPRVGREPGADWAVPEPAAATIRTPFPAEGHTGADGVSTPANCCHDAKLPRAGHPGSDQAESRIASLALSTSFPLRRTWAVAVFCSFSRTGVVAARVEELDQTGQLNHFICFSRGQLDYILRVWQKYYHEQRPHRGVGRDNTVLDVDFVPHTEGRIRCKSELGGILKSYYREAA